MLSFERLTHSDQGLPNPSVEAILQDKEGFLWFGTREGLHRYDGYTFKTYHHDPADATSLSPGIVLSLMEDRQGRYWVGTEDGLNRLDRQKEHFIRYELAADSTYPRQSIRVLFEDRDGVVWTGANDRLYRYDATRDRFEISLPDSPNASTNATSAASSKIETATSGCCRKTSGKTAPRSTRSTWRKTKSRATPSPRSGAR